MSRERLVKLVKEKQMEIRMLENELRHHRPRKNQNFRLDIYLLAQTLVKESTEYWAMLDHMAQLIRDREKRRTIEREMDTIIAKQLMWLQFEEPKFETKTQLIRK